MNTDTPETDAQHLQFAIGGFTLDFCRKLERERDTAQEQRHKLAESILNLSHPNCKMLIREAAAPDQTTNDQAVDLPRLVRNFCEGQEWAAQTWKDQPHIKPLFDFANANVLARADSTTSPHDQTL